VNLRYVARANSAIDPVVIIIIAAINTVIIVALRYDRRVIMNLIQITHTHRGSDTRRHHRHILQDRKNDRVNFDK